MNSSDETALRKRLAEAASRLAVLEADVAASNAVFDEIAKICGCAQWDYPGQIVRDVRSLAERAEKAEQECVRLGKLVRLHVRFCAEAQPDEPKCR
jgi:hypothetical protein